MTAQIELLAVAMVTSLNAASPLAGVTFTSSWAYLPTQKREDLSSLSVLVVPRGETTERESRSGWRSEYRLDVGVRKMVANDLAAPGTLTAVAEAIFDLFSNSYPSGRNEVLWAREWPDVLASETLEDELIFGCVQTLTFRGRR